MRALLTVAWVALCGLLVWYAAAYKAPAIEQDILTRASAAVSAVNPNTEVTVDGRFVTVKGLAPDEEARAKTLAAAADVWGALGPVDALWVPREASAPGVVLAEKSADGTLTLTGSVPTQDARAAIEAAAKKAFTEAVDNRLAVNGSGSATFDGIDEGFAALAGLETGSLLATAQRYQLTGTAAEPSAATAAEALASANPDRWQVYLGGAGLVPPRLGIVKSPDGAIVALGDVPTEQARTDLVAAFLAADPDRRVVDRIVVRSGGFPADWLDRAMLGVRALSALDWGSLSLDGARSYLAGMAAPGRLGTIGDSLGPGFTAELTPRPADPDSIRIARLEREIAAAQARNLDLSAAGAKHIADLDVAQARLEAFERRAGQETGDLAAARTRIAELEAAQAKVVTDFEAAEKRLRDLTTAGGQNASELDSARSRIQQLEQDAARAKSELDAANTRIAGLTEMLSLRPDDSLTAPAPAGPTFSIEPQPAAPSVAQPSETAPPAASQPPAAAEQPDTQPAAPAPDVALAPPAEPAAPPPPASTPLIAPKSAAVETATTCNSAAASVLGQTAITFESKSAQITRDGNAVLDRLVAEASACVGNPTLRVVVGGHTDSRGRDADNLRLSQARAEAVKEALIVRSIPPDDITAIGYGETLPIADNETEEGQQANRRITIDWSLR